MLKTLILTASVLLSVCLYAQEEPVKTDAEIQADSLLNNFFNNMEGDPRFIEGIDSARLEKAENDYMDDFLQLERDPEKELLHKRILQVTIGLALLTILFIGFRRRNRQNKGDRGLSRN
jgi:hypothetical protein